MPQHFTLEDLEELEKSCMGQDTLEYARNLITTFPRIAAEIRRLWDLEKTIGTWPEMRQQAYQAGFTSAELLYKKD